MNVKKASALGLGTVLLLAIVFFKPLGFLRNTFYDSNFAFSNAQGTSDSVAIVSIDAESISSIGGWPWPRSTIAGLIDRLNSYAPRVVALDILFPPKREDGAGNDSLSHVFKKVNKLILPFRASSIREGDGGGAARPVIPADVLRQRFLMVTNAKKLDDASFFGANRIDASDEMFTRSSAQSGVINVTTSKTDQRLREIVHVIRAGDDFFPSFGLCSVAAYLNLKPDEFVLDGRPQVRLGALTMPVTAYAGSSLLHFRGRAGTVSTIPAASVLNGSAKSEALRDKLVFVGVTDAGAQADFFITPVGSQFPGVELWATSAMDVLQKSWIRAADASGMLTTASIALALLLFPGLALVFGAKKKALSIGIGLAGCALSIVIGLFVFKAFHCFWDPSPHVAAWVFSVLFIAAQKGVPGLVEYAPFTFDVPSAEDRDSIAAPKEEDFLRTLPQSETAAHIARKITATSATEARRPLAAAETFSGTLVEEHGYGPAASAGVSDGASRATSGIDKSDSLSPEQAAKFGDLCGGRIVKLLGSGGMADVYLVWNPRIEMYRAVKVIKPGQPSNLLARFETEIRILSKLAHPHIVQFFNVGDWFSLPYIEMEFVPGASTEDILEKCGTFSSQEAAAIGIVVCRALDYAHKKTATIYGNTYNGVIHRDLKPANIMLSKSGRMKLTDFGIARPRNVSLHTMDTGAVVGTLPYLAPEQLSGGQELTAKVDIYALGATLYEYLTGGRAFPQTEVVALVSAKSSGQVAPLPGKVGGRLGEIIRKAMAIQPQDRYESAAAMEKDLDKVLRDGLRPKPASGHAVLSQLVKRFEA